MRPGGTAAIQPGPGALIAARVRDAGPDRVELSPAACVGAPPPPGESLSLFRTPADRIEAATGVARGRLVDRRA